MIWILKVNNNKTRCLDRFEIGLSIWFYLTYIFRNCSRLIIASLVYNSPTSNQSSDTFVQWSNPSYIRDLDDLDCLSLLRTHRIHLLLRNLPAVQFLLQLYKQWNLVFFVQRLPSVLHLSKVFKHADIIRNKQNHKTEGLNETFSESIRQ